MKLFILALVIALVGCEAEQPDTNHVGVSHNSIRTICLNGVKYYQVTAGYRGALSPVINKDTLTFETCEIVQ